DVRPPEEYRAGHIPGAVSIPVAELKARLKELPRDREIVAYCRGPYCVMALDAVDFLRKKGFKARRMEQGVADWRARGFRVESRGASPGPPASTRDAKTSGHESAAPRSSREPRSVLAARRRQRFRGRNGRHGAHDPPADRRARLPPRGEDGGAFVHCR